MRSISALSVLVVIFCWAAGASAVELAALDRVHVLMPRAQVVSILGSTVEVMKLADGLTVEIYPVDSAHPLTHSGCIYNKEGLLMGQSFVFEGRFSGDMVDRLKKHGFLQLHKESKSHENRLAGHDDDTGKPLVAVIEEAGMLTTITTFERSFYQSTVENRPLLQK